MEEADFEYSLDFGLLTRPISLPEDWEARWCDSLDRYEFHNSVTDITKLDFPIPSATTLGRSSPWKISGGPREMSAPLVLGLLSRVFYNTNEYYTPESLNTQECIHELRRVLYYDYENFGKISGMLVDLVAAIEDEKAWISLQHRSLVNFLYARLKDARTAIEKLEPADSIVGELYHADKAPPTKESEHPIENFSRIAKPGNTSSSSPLTITQQFMDFEPSQNHSLTSTQHSPIVWHAQQESTPIQVHELEGDASNHPRGNSDSTKDRSSARKRKRQKKKDPTRFKHECDTCGQRFTRSTTLREHCRTHTNERPFPCSKCLKKFARKKDQIRHEKLHLGERKFNCRMEGQDADRGCGRCFAREDGLVAHLRTERGRKCLQDFVASTYCRTRIEFLLRHKDGFSCELTQSGCHGKFDDFSAPPLGQWQQRMCNRMAHETISGENPDQSVHTEFSILRLRRI